MSAIISNRRQSKPTTEYDYRAETEKQEIWIWIFITRTRVAWDPCDLLSPYTIQRVHSERRTKWMSKNKWSIIGRACECKSTWTRPGITQEKEEKKKNVVEEKEKEEERQNRFSIWDGDAE